jgi:hypothetical protein
MKTQSHSMKGARTFLLGMLAGASIVTAGLVLGRAQHLSAPHTAIIQSQSSATGDSRAALQDQTALPATIDLPRAVVVGHRLKIVVQGASQANSGDGAAHSTI